MLAAATKWHFRSNQEIEILSCNRDAQGSGKNRSLISAIMNLAQALLPVPFLLAGYLHLALAHISTDCSTLKHEGANDQTTDDGLAFLSPLCFQS